MPLNQVVLQSMTNSAQRSVHVDRLMVAGWTGRKAGTVPIKGEIAFESLFVTELPDSILQRNISPRYAIADLEPQR